ncbi:protein Hook homolog 2 isoform X2 [Dendropsophus ebraccatus]|uniref:protein Hook homolog 2 isoform X2 n=1 Tax=Dendropsophus ebraccatus TaxID=150705 RepID=UPI0038321DA5
MSGKRKGEQSDPLLTWMQTFPVSGPCASYKDLTGGLAIGQVLNLIDSSWFNEAWLMRIKPDSSDNWRLKVSNLKRILQSVLEYYQDVLGHPVSEDHIPDVGLIGEFSDTAELRKMVQLVLGCAISCDKKEEHIQQIMTLGESVQQAVMESIQELLSKEPTDAATADSYVNYDSQSRKYYFLSEDTDEKTGILHRCHELEQQVSLLMEEKRSLITENRVLREQQETPDGEMGAPQAFSKKMLLLQSQIEQLQEENYRLESARDDYRQRCEELDREVQDLHQRNQDLTGLAHEAQSLRDEMDILRHSSDRVGKLESLVESYKKKLEDLGDLRRQVKLLEERNTVYMQRTCQLEEELHKAHASRGQVESLSRQVQEMNKKHSAESLWAEKWQFEFQTLKEKYEALQKEKERLVAERDSLRETNEELRCSHLQQTCLVQADALSGLSSPVENLAAEILPAELKETVVRLQQENKMLCVQEASYQQRLSELQNLLEESNRSRNRMEGENRLNQQQIQELRAQVEDLQRQLREQGSKAEDSSQLKRKLEEHLELLHDAHSELQKKREYIETLQPKADLNMSRKVDELQQILQQKEEDMRAMEDRYIRYVEKARTVIKNLDPKQQNYIPPEIQALKNQLQEKETRIRHLETDFEKTKSQRDQEEKLIISAWYNMGMALQQKVTDDRTQVPSGAQSFLAQQRLATNARRGQLSRSLLPRYTSSDKRQSMS